MKLSALPVVYSGVVASSLLLCLVLHRCYGYKIDTHCNNDQFLPSISMTIGDHFPMTLISRIAFAIVLTPKVLCIVLWHKQLAAMGVWMPTVALLSLLDCVRVTSSWGWSFVSSREMHAIHVDSFSVYAVVSLVHHALHYIVTRTRLPAPSRRAKLLCVVTEGSCLFTGHYIFFRRHQQMCVANAYSVAAVFEWIFAMANLGYDGSAYYDFSGAIGIDQVT